MAKKSKNASASTGESSSEELPKETAAESTASGPMKRGRGRPKGTQKKPDVKKKGKRGRPKGSKNRTKAPLSIGKRPRGRPPGSSKKAMPTGTNLRGIITEIVREEVHSALLAAFKGL